ncbi:polyketide biosynthesis enoyl-CoA hydratase [Candidatus Magnetomorum sp. HK-1]|nr:polyketide biosynthesis enoyl-CoA hydratase [Candidatus Magnetomorum sp. HK-1]
MTHSVVKFQIIEESIVLLTMEDRIHKNTFSEDLTLGLKQSFEIIDQNSEYKAVIMTGYDSYFCSGGTQKGLLEICDGKSQFTDSNLYSLPLECKIPVISAMQGHAIGGGFAFGLSADFIILSKESVYTTNFMKYGFTPGMGSTLILTEKLGISLAEELLFTANNYRGAELEKRGIPFTVHPRKDVMPYALELARQLADKPRISLITLKDHLVASLREKLPKTIEKELAMHEKTFHLPEVKGRIKNSFGG